MAATENGIGLVQGGFGLRGTPIRTTSGSTTRWSRSAGPGLGGSLRLRAQDRLRPLKGDAGRINTKVEQFPVPIPLQEAIESLHEAGLAVGIGLGLSVVIRVGVQPCFFSSLRINFNAAWAFRFDCTRKSRTSPSLSTARHNQ